MRRFIFICCLVLLSTPAFAGDVASAFDNFCAEWMQKLEAREEANVSHIKWEPNGAGVQGAYVGYTQEHTCTLKDGQKVPVGKIMYQEVRYLKRGPTITEAQQSIPHPVETTAVTEIFGYDHGKWVY
jgi:hypothetical protein